VEYITQVASHMNLIGSCNWQLKDHLQLVVKVILHFIDMPYIIRNRYPRSLSPALEAEYRRWLAIG
jgi:hypothetical protein